MPQALAVTTSEATEASSSASTDSLIATGLFNLGKIDLFAPVKKGRPRKADTAKPTSAATKKPISTGQLRIAARQKRRIITTRIIHLRTQYCAECHSEHTFPDGDFLAEETGDTHKTSIWRQREQNADHSAEFLARLPTEFYNTREEIDLCSTCLYTAAAAGSLTIFSDLRTLSLQHSQYTLDLHPQVPTSVARPLVETPTATEILKQLFAEETQ